jgi:TolA-binding protein
MSERYQSKYVLPTFQHQTGSPLILQAGSILFDTQTGKLLAQLKLQNISRRTIKAAFLSLLCYDTLLNRVGEPPKQQYLDLSAGPGQSFGDRVPLFLPDVSVRSIDVSLTGVLFSDESVWKSADEGVFAPIQGDERQTLSASLLAQLNRDGADQKASTIEYTVTPQWSSNLWQCACSQWNLTGRVCVQCNTSRDWLRGAAEPEGLQKRLEEHERRLEEERAQQEQRREQERLEKEQLARQTAAKRKKTLSIVISLVLVFAAATYYITQMYIPGKNYEKAANLLAGKQYDQASEAFKALGDYSDSAVMVQQSIYQKGTDLLSGKQYDHAAAAFESLGAYSDSAEMVKESAYQKGKALADSQRYAEAAAILIGIKDYKDTASLIAGNVGLSSAAAAAAAELDRKFTVGNVVVFGRYEQDDNQGNGKEPVQWRVLRREGKKALLISVQNLDCQPYNGEWTSVTWETCTLRTWLNGTFLNAAFTAEEQKGILTTAVKNDDNPEYKTDGVNHTQDRVFLLSIAEAETLFRSDADRAGKNTAYAKAQGAYDSSGAGWWWLRSPGISQLRAAIVDADGSVRRNGALVNDVDSAVRPALWLDLTSGIFASEAP